MEAFRKQASKLREQVAKQQQAVLRQLGHLSNDGVVVDEDEIQCHQQLQNLYNSTRTAKHYQRNIVRGVENFISMSSKQMEIVRKLAEDCCRYGNENQSSSDALANASLQFGTSHKSMEEERENMIRIFDAQVSEPLRASIGGAPLDDARHLTHRYDRIRQEVDTQAAEVSRRQQKSKEAGASSENSVKLQNAEAKLAELKSTMMALGREAMAAMLSVETQQQQLTSQRLLTMVNAERFYHHSAADILEKLHAEMIVQKQNIESASQPAKTTYVYVPPEHPENKSYKSGDIEPDTPKDVYVPPGHPEKNSYKSGDIKPDTPKDTSFIAEVIHPFDAQADGELDLSVGDYIVVRQVTSHGWSEGKSMGKAGWFPTAYIEKRDKAPVSKVTELQ